MARLDRLLGQTVLHGGPALAPSPAGFGTEEDDDR